MGEVDVIIGQNRICTISNGAMSASFPGTASGLRGPRGMLARPAGRPKIGAMDQMCQRSRCPCALHRSRRSPEDPFTLGHERSGWADMFQTLEMVLVRVETDAGLVGWGDAFAYGCQRAVVAAIEDMIAPRWSAPTPATSPGSTVNCSGRITCGAAMASRFSLFPADIALWDLAGKAAGKPWYSFWAVAAPRLCRPTPACSLWRSGTVARVTEEVLGAGYDHVKLHEITVRRWPPARRRTEFRADGRHQLPVDPDRGPANGCRHGRARSLLVGGTALPARGFHRFGTPA